MQWLEPDWVVNAARAAAAAGQPTARIHACWHHTSVATGRLSCSSPNLQAVTKYRVQAMQPALGQADAGALGGAATAATATATAGSSAVEINIRDAFVAPPGHLLLACDYSQIELRLLAHMSGDVRLASLLRSAGVAGDAFALIARSWLQAPPINAAGAVTKEAREKAKRVTYGA